MLVVFVVAIVVTMVDGFVSSSREKKLVLVVLP
jgi:hypothetical protein